MSNIIRVASIKAIERRRETLPMEWLNYHHLLYFWTVVREGGVSRAAEKLRLAQPTVSAQVKVLEDTLGQPLFDRQGRRLILTDDEAPIRARRAPATQTVPAASCT